MPLLSKLVAINENTCANMSKDEVMAAIADAKAAGVLVITFESASLAGGADDEPMDAHPDAFNAGSAEDSEEGATIVPNPPASPSVRESTLL